MRVASLFSGGKDSTHALYLAQQMGWSVERLVTIVPQADSMMFHHPNIGLTELHSEALGIPLIKREAGPEDELGVLEAALGELAVDGLVLGAIASDYQQTRINEMCHRIGLRTFAPIWRRDQETVLRDEVGAGFDITIVGVSAEGLTEEWLGRTLSEDTLEELVGLSERTRFNVSGEGGEYETLVVDGPNFRKRIRIEKATAEWDGMRGTYRVERASLVDKTNLI
jgi:ABC transporter with metal-binding/Fe-S-binding domain ATP-binding protein